MADEVAFGLLISLIHIAHMVAIIYHNLQLYGYSIFITGITMCGGIRYICQHIDVPFVSTVLLSGHPWLLHEYPLVSISFSWVLGIVAYPSCSV
jgi:hypothetical protein